MISDKRKRAGIVLLVFTICLILTVSTIYSFFAAGEIFIALAAACCLLALCAQAVFGRPSLKDVWLLLAKNAEFILDDETRQLNKKRMYRVSVILFSFSCAYICWLVISNAKAGILFIVAFMLLRKELRRSGVATGDFKTTIRLIWSECKWGNGAATAHINQDTHDSETHDPDSKHPHEHQDA